MPDEAGAVSQARQLLVATDDEPPVAGLAPAEEAAGALLAALAAAGVPLPGEPPRPDVTVPPGTVPAGVAGLATTLRELRATTPAAPAGAYDAVDVDVLGETVRLRVRDDRQRGLKRLAELHRALDSLAASGVPVQVLTLPDLDDLDRAILHAVRESAPSRASLPAEVRRRLAELETVVPAPETIAGLRRHAALAGDPAALDARLARLRDWGLLDDRGDPPAATAKLRRVRF